MGQSDLVARNLKARSLVCGLILFATSSFFVGCGRSGPEFAPAVGLVTFDGQPVADAGVMFTPLHGGPVASATTDDEGRFALRTLSNEGALLGEHQVSITKGRTEEKKVPNAMMPLIRYVSELPEKYSRRDTSELKATVNSDEDFNDYTFSLTSK